MNRLENAFKVFTELLLFLLEAKNVLTSTEILSIRNAVKAFLPSTSSKYYTKEVYEKLVQLLDKDLNDYTMADVEEMKKIGDLIEKKGYESNRKDLVEYSYKLRFLAMLIRVGVIYPKLRQVKKLFDFIVK